MPLMSRRTSPLRAMALALALVLPAVLADAALAAAPVPGAASDRKSTRLNSSHT